MYCNPLNLFTRNVPVISNRIYTILVNMFPKYGYRDKKCPVFLNIYNGIGHPNFPNKMCVISLISD